MAEPNFLDGQIVSPMAMVKNKKSTSTKNRQKRRKKNMAQEEHKEGQKPRRQGNEEDKILK